MEDFLIPALRLILLLIIRKFHARKTKTIFQILFEIWNLNCVFLDYLINKNFVEGREIKWDKLTIIKKMRKIRKISVHSVRFIQMNSFLHLFRVSIASNEYFNQNRNRSLSWLNGLSRRNRLFPRILSF